MARTRNITSTPADSDQDAQTPETVTPDQTSTDQEDTVTEVTSTDEITPDTADSDQGDQDVTPAEPTSTPDQEADPVADVLTKITEAAGSADSDTGTVPEAALEPVRAAYKGLTPARRTKIQSELAARMTAALRDGKVTEALTLGSVSQALAATPAGGTEKTPADPYAGPVALGVALRLIAEVGYEIMPLPEGVDVDTLDSKINERAAELLSADYSSDTACLHALRDGAVADDTPAEYVLAAKIVSGRGAGKITKRASGPRAPRTVGEGQRDLGKIIAEVMSAHPGEPMKVSRILSLAEEAGHGRLSSGAVSNRIKNSTVPGVSQSDVDGALGAVYEA